MRINYHNICMNDETYYVLGWPQPSGKVAVLCRSRGQNAGPAYCWTKREAIQLRTRLANDRRGEENPSARRIIRQLLVYKYYCASRSSGVRASSGSISILAIWKQSKLYAQFDTQILLTTSGSICRDYRRMLCAWL